MCSVTIATPTLFIGTNPTIEILSQIPETYSGGYDAKIDFDNGNGPGNYTTFCSQPKIPVKLNQPYDITITMLDPADPKERLIANLLKYFDSLDPQYQASPFVNDTIQLACWTLHKDNILPSSDLIASVINIANEKIELNPDLYPSEVIQIHLSYMGPNGETIFGQDQLAYIPTPQVPVPSAMLLGGIGISLVGWTRVKKII